MFVIFTIFMILRDLHYLFAIFVDFHDFWDFPDFYRFSWFFVMFMICRDFSWFSCFLWCSWFVLILLDLLCKIVDSRFCVELSIVFFELFWPRQFLLQNTVILILRCRSISISISIKTYILIVRLLTYAFQLLISFSSGFTNQSRENHERTMKDHAQTMTRNENKYETHA